MGVDPEWRQILLRVLRKRGAAARCFFAALPAGAPTFDVVVFDLMQELAMVKMSPVGTMTGADLKRRVQDVLYRHLGCASQYGDAPAGGDVAAGRLVVACVDNVYRVPRNKSFVEAARDKETGAAHIISTGDHYARIVAEAARHAVEAARQHALRQRTVSTEDVARAMEEARAGFSDATSFLLTDGPFPAGGTEIWRNIALSWQLKRLVTEAVCAMGVPGAKLLLLDEGLPLGRERYAELRARMLTDHHATNWPPVQRAALVGQLMGSCVRRVLVAPHSQCRELPATGLGESDHKMCYYVQRRAPLGCAPMGARVRYLVKCQDTDVMWQLLAHMRSLINPATGVIDEVDVWMDTQTPADRVRGESREYRFIDVVALWRALHDWFAEDFPALRNPLETFLFAVFCNNNDYVERFPPHMQLGPAAVWNTFMELLAAGSDRPSYIGSSGSTVRIDDGHLDRHYIQLGKRLNTLTVCGDTAMRGPPVAFDTPIAVRAETAADFFYALVQRAASIKKMARAHGNTRWPLVKGAYVHNSDELFDMLLQMYHAEAAHAAPGVVLPPLFDVPAAPAMKARVARVQWTLNYYINGWKTAEYAHNWFATNGEYARHGWIVRDVTDDERLREPNSQYLYAEYCHVTGAVGGHAYRYYQPLYANEVAQSPH